MVSFFLREMRQWYLCEKFLAGSNWKYSRRHHAKFPHLFGASLEIPPSAPCAGCVLRDLYGS
jgi:hypothetical protein